MIGKIRDFFQELKVDWEDQMWRVSDERKELAKLRLAAHNLALEEGRASSYTHPEDYTANWTPLMKLKSVKANF